MARLWTLRRRRLLLLLVGLAVCGELTHRWWMTHTDAYTDNAYVVGNITPISSYVTGQVVALYVDDNMIVQPGDPIAQVNPVEFQIAVDQALADYQQAGNAAAAADVTTNYTTEDRRSMLVAAQAHRAEAEQAVQAATVAVQTHTRLHEKEKEVLGALQARMPGLKALERNAKYYYDRFQSLAKSGDVPIQEFDNREAAYRSATANVESLTSDIRGAERQVLASELQLQEAKVRLEQARKALANTEATVGRAQAEQMQ
jgi:membrane fusion protein (multidrug efflux system)